MFPIAFTNAAMKGPPLELGVFVVAAKVHAGHKMLLDGLQCAIDLSLVVEPVASQNLIA